MRWDAKADQTQQEIMRAVREFGGEVQSLHRVGQGVPDLLVAYQGQWFLVECKSYDSVELTPKEAEWHERFSRHAPVLVWRSWRDVWEEFVGREKWWLALVGEDK